METIKFSVVGFDIPRLGVCQAVCFDANNSLTAYLSLASGYIFKRDQAVFIRERDFNS